MAGFRPREFDPAGPIPTEDLGVTQRVPARQVTEPLEWRRPPGAVQPVAAAAPAPAPAAPARFRPSEITPGPPTPPLVDDPNVSFGTPARIGADPAAGARPDYTATETPEKVNPGTAFWRRLVPGYDYGRAGTAWLESLLSKGEVPPEGWALAQARKEGQAAEREHPGAALAGDLAPLATMLIPGPAVVNAASKAAEARPFVETLKRVVPQSLYAGLMRLGLSDAPGVGGKAKDAGTAAAVAGGMGLLGEGIASVTRRAPAQFDEWGVNAGRRFLSGNQSPLAVREDLPEPAIRSAVDRGAIRFGTRVQRADKILGKELDTAGQRIGNVIQRGEAAGMTGNTPREIAVLQDTEGRNIENFVGNSPRPDVYRGEAESLWPLKAEREAQAAIDAFPTEIQQAQVQARREVAKLDAQLARQGVPPALRQTLIAEKMRTFQPTIEQPPPMPTFRSPKDTLGPNGRLSLSQQIGMEREAQDLASAAYRTPEGRLNPLGKAKKGVAAIHNRTTNDQILSQAGLNPEAAQVAADWLPANADYGPLADAYSAAHESAARMNRRNILGASEFAGLISGAGAGATTHAPLQAIASAAGGAVLGHLVRTRGASSLAATNRGISHLLEALTHPPPVVSLPGSGGPINFRFAPSNALPVASEQIGQRYAEGQTDEEAQQAALEAAAQDRLRARRLIEMRGYGR